MLLFLYEDTPLNIWLPTKKPILRLEATTIIFRTLYTIDTIVEKAILEKIAEQRPRCYFFKVCECSFCGTSFFCKTFAYQAILQDDIYLYRFSQVLESSAYL